jgi:hypothetical protein
VDNNQLAFELQVGDNFVVYVEFENEKRSLFWVFKCVRCLYMYERDQPLVDYYNFIIEKGDEVMESLYYNNQVERRLHL